LSENERVGAWIEAWTKGLSVFELVGGVFVENLLICLLALAAGEAIVRLLPRRRVTPPPLPLSAHELALGATTVILNSGVTLLGYALWRRGVIRFRDDTGPRAWLDVVVLLLVMDAAMYVLHRIAHHPLLYRIHAPHHRYERVRPLTLFVLSPLEVAGFGGLWLLVIALYPASWLGMSVYLALNVAFGTVGHLGVEIVPRWWAHLPGFRAVATSTFHAGHHLDRNTNFGFYTVVWDRLFTTLDPEYFRRFDERSS
jgi:lathosterol oxidase